MKGLLQYKEGYTIIHRLNPISKLVLSFILCLAGFLSSQHLFVLLILGINLLTAALAGTLSRCIRILYSLLKLSLLLFLVQVLFVRDGNVLLPLPFGIVITDTGIAFSLLFVLRLLTATLPVALMLSVTRVGDIANALTKIVGVPYKYAFALSTALGFVPLFSQEMNEIMEAQTARGVDMDTKNIFKKIGLVVPLCAPLLISSVKKTEQAAISAELRGFALRKRDSGYRDYPFLFADWIAFIFGATIITCGILV